MATIDKSAVRNFINRWQGQGSEDSDTQSFWTDLLHDVFDVDKPNDIIKRENHVKLDKNHNGSIDIYMPQTRVLIEQKSLGIDLNKPILQSDGSLLTPFEQAKRYSDQGLGIDEKARWIVACNFQEFNVYDMRDAHPRPEIIELKNLESEYRKLEFLIDVKAKAPKEIRELEISVRAGELVHKLYEALKTKYINPDSPEALRSLNIFCVRIVFLLYAEDAGLFNKNSVHDYISSRSSSARNAIIELFKILAQKPEDRDPYIDDDLKNFPYVNGGLFEEAGIEIPTIDETILNIILDDMSSGFDWSGINPTIFGSLFESTLNPETRSLNGMHYTSIENIHRVIDPLFFDDLKSKFDAIINLPVNSKRNKELVKFQNKLASLKFLDPACGSGNFLTETYLSLRRLENKILKELDATGQIKMILNADDSPVKVSINQFYGIEINDFAVAVAKAALWIAEHQMIRETQDILHDFYSNYLPLKTYANITEANALKIDWRDVIKPEDLNYIIGNPPFRGARVMSFEQKTELAQVFDGWDNVGNLDYVSCWYKKASDMMKGYDIKAALVSTNSISQGDAVAVLWKPLMAEGVHIDFAWRTFKWNSESADVAHVHVVIIGFSCGADKAEKFLYTLNSDGTAEAVRADHINAYLLNAPDVFVESRQQPLCDVPVMSMGNQPIDGGNYLFKKDKMEEFIKKEPASKKYFHPWYGADEFINNRQRYCLYLGNCTPHELKSMPECLKLIEAVRNLRLASSRASTRQLADTPTKFQTEIMPDGIYIVIPQTSSEKRFYIPIGFMDSSVLCSDKVRIIPGATLYHFGILISRVHMAWMRAVAGRLKSDYSYSNTIVYNNFPWPSPSAKQRDKIEQAAQKTLGARALYPNSSLADLYNDTLMPDKLRKAHKLNDAAVCEAYGFDKDISEDDIVAKLMRMYQELIMRL